MLLVTSSKLSLLLSPCRSGWEPLRLGNLQRLGLIGNRRAQPERLRLFHDPGAELVLAHAGELHRPLPARQNAGYLVPILDRGQLAQSPSLGVHTQPASSRYLV